jgi:flagellar secretion chaperone FliS
MAQFNPYKQYDNVTFGTADPASLVITAYNGAIRALKEIVRAINENDYDARVKNVDLAFELVSELRKSLKPEQSNEFVEKLSALYEFFTREIVTANAYSDPERLRPIIKMMGDLRDAWAEAKRVNSEA